MNPGYDLLLAANWSAVARRESAGREPPLTGLSQFAASSTSTPALAPSPLPRSGASALSASGSRLQRNLLVVLGFGVAFVAATTLVLKSRTRRKPR